MPAARQASRSSGKALAVSAMMRAALARLGLGGADAAGRFQPVHAGHVHIHQDEIVGHAGGARGQPGFHRRLAVARPRSDDGRAAPAARAPAAR